MRTEFANIRTNRINSRSLHYAPPDFLWDYVALVRYMRLSLRKGAHAALLSQRGRKSWFAPVGMTNSPGPKDRTADPLGFAPNDTEGEVRNNPTQAKRRLEWATPNFLAGRTAGVISPSTCRRQVEVLGMTQGRIALPLDVVVSTTACGCCSFLSQLVAGKSSCS